MSDLGYVAIYPMKSKGEFYDALHLFCKEIGVPNSLVVDPSGEQTSSKVKKFCHQVGTTLRILEESTQWANRAELYIGLFKESIRKDLAESNSPLKLWDYCAERRARIHNVTPKDLFQLHGETPIAATLGIQGDISNICQFAWYDWCYYREESNIQFPFQKRQLGRVLGSLKNEGNEMTQAVLTIKGTVIPRRSCTPLTVADSPLFPLLHHLLHSRRHTIAAAAKVHDQIDLRHLPACFLSVKKALLRLRHILSHFLHQIIHLDLRTNATR